MNAPSDGVLIVGAGQAGLQVAVSLRQGGYTGPIVLLGKEPHAPYQRPPLSKQVLKGEWPAERCQLKQGAYFKEQSIDFRAGTEAVALDTDQQVVTLAEGEQLKFEFLVICTGSRLNRLELRGSGLKGVRYLRTIEDAVCLRERLADRKRLVVAGGGYIGLEVAASARQLGCEVKVVEAQDHIMQRSALPPVADFLLERHQLEGVAFHFGRLMTDIHGGSTVRAVSLDDGSLLETDLVLKGIGVRPELRWLEGSGLELGMGIRVDAACRTNFANVFAAGDCCEVQHPYYSEPVVLESVQNAVSQGKIAAASILGQNPTYDEPPWFWSEQYGFRLQMAGLPQPGDDLVIRDTGPHTLSVLSMAQDRLNAVQCINIPGDYMAGRKLIARGASVDLAQLKNPSTELRNLL